MRRHLGQVVDTLREWRRRQCYRAYLGAMDERGLKDIGLSRPDAEREVDRRFWQKPVVDEATRGRGRRSTTGLSTSA